MEEADFDKFILENLDIILDTLINDDPFRSTLLSHYAVLRIRAFERMVKMEDLEEAIRKAEGAVKATPQDHPDLAGRLNNLGNMLESRYERTGRMEDLEEAIRKAEGAVEATPEDHPDLAGRLN